MSQMSDALRNNRAAQLQATVGASGTMEFRTGNPPANCAAATTGTKIAGITLPATFMGSPVGGVVAKSGTWEDLSADAAGIIQYARIFDGSAACHYQCLCFDTWAASRAYTVGHQVTNDGGKVYRCTTAGTSAASGGPTGTGGAISDGGVTWAYVSAEPGILLNNCSCNVAQPLSITSWQFTEANA